MSDLTIKNFYIEDKLNKDGNLDIGFANHYSNGDITVLEAIEIIEHLKFVFKLDGEK